MTTAYFGNGQVCTNYGINAQEAVSPMHYGPYVQPAQMYSTYNLQQQPQTPFITGGAVHPIYESLIIRCADVCSSMDPVRIQEYIAAVKSEHAKYRAIADQLSCVLNSAEKSLASVYGLNAKSTSSKKQSTEKKTTKPAKAQKSKGQTVNDRLPTPNVSSVGQTVNDRPPLSVETIAGGFKASDKANSQSVNSLASNSGNTKLFYVKSSRLVTDELKKCVTDYSAKIDGDNVYFPRKYNNYIRKLLNAAALPKEPEVVPVQVASYKSVVCDARPNEESISDWSSMMHNDTKSERMESFRKTIIARLRLHGVSIDQNLVTDICNSCFEHPVASAFMATVEKSGNRMLDDYFEYCVGFLVRLGCDVKSSFNDIHYACVREAGYDQLELLECFFKYLSAQNV